MNVRSTESSGWKRIVAGTFAALWAVNANALVIDAVGDATTITFDNLGGGYTLKATAVVTATALTSTSVTVGITLSNISTLAGGGAIPSAKDVRLTAFGFGVDPAATGVSFSDAVDGGMVDAELNQIPSLKLIEVCAYGGNNCPGGSNGGVWAGLSDVFSLTILGAFADSSGTQLPVTLTPFGVKWQTKAGSFEYYGQGEEGGGGGGGAVPEPMSLALFGIGLVGLGLARRRAAR